MSVCSHETAPLDAAMSSFVFGFLLADDCNQQNDSQPATHVRPSNTTSQQDDNEQDSVASSTVLVAQPHTLALPHDIDLTAHSSSSLCSKQSSKVEWADQVQGDTITETIYHVPGLDAESTHEECLVLQNESAELVVVTNLDNDMHLQPEHVHGSLAPPDSLDTKETRLPNATTKACANDEKYPIKDASNLETQTKQDQLSSSLTKIPTFLLSDNNVDIKNIRETIHQHADETNDKDAIIIGPQESMTAKSDKNPPTLVLADTIQAIQPMNYHRDQDALTSCRQSPTSWSEKQSFMMDEPTEKRDDCSQQGWMMDVNECHGSNDENGVDRKQPTDSTRRIKAIQETAVLHALGSENSDDSVFDVCIIVSAELATMEVVHDNSFVQDDVQCNTNANVESGNQGEEVPSDTVARDDLPSPTHVQSIEDSDQMEIHSVQYVSIDSMGYSKGGVNESSPFTSDHDSARSLFDEHPPDESCHYLGLVLDSRTAKETVQKPPFTVPNIDDEVDSDKEQEQGDDISTNKYALDPEMFRAVPESSSRTTATYSEEMTADYSVDGPCGTKDSIFANEIEWESFENKTLYFQTVQDMSWEESGSVKAMEDEREEVHLPYVAVDNLGRLGANAALPDNAKELTETAALQNSIKVPREYHSNRQDSSDDSVAIGSWNSGTAQPARSTTGIDGTLLKNNSDLSNRHLIRHDEDTAIASPAKDDNDETLTNPEAAYVRRANVVGKEELKRFLDKAEPPFEKNVPSKCGKIPNDKDYKGSSFSVAHVVLIMAVLLMIRAPSIGGGQAETPTNGIPEVLLSENLIVTTEALVVAPPVDGHNYDRRQSCIGCNEADQSLSCPVCGKMDDELCTFMECIMTTENSGNQHLRDSPQKDVVSLTIVEEMVVLPDAVLHQQGKEAPKQKIAQGYLGRLDLTMAGLSPLAVYRN